MKQKQLMVVLIVLLAGLLAASFATYSRVESMGKTDNFYMDDISIFTNPANINLYANFLVGELGQLDDLWSSDYGDPQKQWFGGAGAYKLGDGSKVVAGLAFNREDALVTKLKAYNSRAYRVNFDDSLLIGQFFYRLVRHSTTVGDSIWVGPRSDTLRFSSVQNPDTAGSNIDTVITSLARIVPDTVAWDTVTKNIPEPIGNVEFFLGYSNGKNLNIGGHFYMASQTVGELENEDLQASSRVWRGDVGMTYGIGNHSLELSVGIADVSFNLMPANPKFPEWNTVFSNATSDIALYVNARMFYDVPAIGAKLVPLVRYSKSKVNVFSENAMVFGVGVNKDIEKGVFSAGFEGSLVSAMDSTVYSDPNIAFSGLAAQDKWVTAQNDKNIKFNFGVERNIAWKWFTVRVGGQKCLVQREIKRTDMNGNALSGTGKPVGTEKYWITNPDEDGTAEDVIGFGVGFNFGNKLKVDGTINEKFPYQNPFSYTGMGGKRIATRVSATYSF